MKKFTLLVAVLMMVAFAGTGCKKKQPPPPPMPPRAHPASPACPALRTASLERPRSRRRSSSPTPSRGHGKPSRSKWNSRTKKSKKTFTVPLNSEFKVPDTDLTLKVGNFLPHFTMAADQITSSSNNLENPAAQLEVFQGGKEIFHGWLFSKYPAVHPLTHEKYGVALLEGVKK